MFGQLNQALTHTYKIYIIKSISHSINHRRYFQIFRLHISSGGNLSSISMLRTVLETHYSLHWHVQAYWSIHLLPTLSANVLFSILCPFCGSSTAMGDVVPCLISRLQEKQQSWLGFFIQRRGMQNAGGKDFPPGEGERAVTWFMEPWGVIEGAGTWTVSSSGAALPQKVSAFTEKQDIFSLPSVFKSSWSTLKL